MEGSTRQPDDVAYAKAKCVFGSVALTLMRAPRPSNCGSKSSWADVTSSMPKPNMKVAGRSEAFSAVATPAVAN